MQAKENPNKSLARNFQPGICQVDYHQNQQDENDGVGDIKVRLANPKKKLDYSVSQNAPAPREIMRPLRLKNIAEGIDALAVLNFRRTDFH